jgi:hypothetical protein
MFGTLPAYGLFCRHVRNLNLRGVETAFEARDERPAVVCDDVDGLEIASARLSGVLPLRFARVRNALIHGCRAVDEVAAFLEVRDRDTGPVSLVGNDLGKAKIDVIEPERRVFRAANRESGR